MTPPTHLNAGGRDDVAELEVELAEELGEVVQQHQQHAQRALVQQSYRVRQLGIAQERLQEAQLQRAGGRPGGTTVRQGSAR